MEPAKLWWMTMTRSGVPRDGLVLMGERYDIPVNYEVKKKRCRAQCCKATLQLPSPQPKKLTGECTVRREIRSPQNILWGSASE
ncbi:uncharacterized protein LOC129872095 isoform X2 [Solanum dulcamara]|uniref:uncharacterized protein LOC129872095 isoform X2 n=1 Tax=Solanum dulcamara TaxID=45834 RepID=UPI00248598F3|nr:uncharacterized protein LOC129872095 isoform X2 [Solanum dulcamara]